MIKKKSIVPRMTGLFAGYIIIFFALVLVQFTKYGNFTKRIEGLMVSAQYKDRVSGYSLMMPLGFDCQSITGRAVVSFNGMEYRLTEENKFSLVYADGRREIRLPEHAAFLGDRVIFRFIEGTSLTFAVQEYADGWELVISADFAGGAERLELPYRLLAASRIQQADGGRFFITYNGVRYGFNRTLMDPDKQILALTNNDPFIAYQVMDAPAGEEAAPPENSEDQSFNVADFVIAQASGEAEYNNAIEQWRTRMYNAQRLSASSDEAQVMAYISESIHRNTYSQALRAAPASFVNSAINASQNLGQKTYASSPYFGRLDQALRSLGTFERNANTRLTQEIDSRSLDFFKEYHAIELLSLGGANAVVDAAAVWARSIDPSAITPDCVPGVLENYMDWEAYRPAMENPFARFNDRVYSLISASIRKNSQGDKVFVFNNGSADMLFNLRLGKALSLYAENAGNDGWAAAARSVVLSVLSMTNDQGLAPKELLVSDIMAERPTSVEASVTVHSAYLYRELGIGENYARAVSVVGGTNTPLVWTWTAATRISASLAGDLGAAGSSLDIEVDFPAGETHYMLIRNIPPSISRLQLYNQIYRTAADFERYNSSGWVYSASEQTLLVKMRHRSQIEHIRIFW
ncbi:MAG: hypothetical protein LBL45_09235 [Treponema sp.]|jgi:hypothetical protein|nr:hypothetical protein [Treponema sp.]